MNVLTKKAGPFARWVWGVIAVGGVFVYRVHKMRHGVGQQPGGNQAYASPITPPDLAYVPGGEIPISPDIPSPSSNDTGGLLALLSELIQQRKGGEPSKPGTTPGSKPKPRQPKPKAKKPKPKPKVKHPPKHKPRSKSHEKKQPRGHTGGHPVSHNRPSMHEFAPGTQHHHKSPVARQRVPLVGHVPNATTRPPASHTKTQHEPPRPAPRPSSPPKRTVRRITGGRS